MQFWRQYYCIFFLEYRWNNQNRIATWDCVVIISWLITLYNLFSKIWRQRIEYFHKSQLLKLRRCLDIIALTFTGNLCVVFYKFVRVIDFHDKTVTKNRMCLFSFRHLQTTTNNQGASPVFYVWDILNHGQKIVKELAIWKISPQNGGSCLLAIKKSKVEKSKRNRNYIVIVGNASRKQLCPPDLFDSSIYCISSNKRRHLHYENIMVEKLVNHQFLIDS